VALTLLTVRRAGWDPVARVLLEGLDDVPSLAAPDGARQIAAW